ncbi:hypothetical protein CRENPOLYSF2_3990001 [Crenothrix polyspora]|uniref:Uncharacterized protein n=1 Tax=Crenothrix polyspora TaxID=360316 RepID=A0A1R4HDV4_9GAMM|nr:hypothetical protein CRENPOLYSF2_3990001 [Crenothrix polyspora]
MAQAKVTETDLWNLDQGVARCDTSDSGCGTVPHFENLRYCFDKRVAKAS